jgi:hypothetical protein
MIGLLQWLYLLLHCIARHGVFSLTICCNQIREQCQRLLWIQSYIHVILPGLLLPGLLLRDLLLRDLLLRDLVGVPRLQAGARPLYQFNEHGLVNMSPGSFDLPFLSGDRV